MPKSIETIDQYIQNHAADQRETVTRLRRLIQTSGPNLHETMKWGNLCYVGRKNVCAIIPYSGHVNLAFFRGAELQDPDGLLEGTGKAMRHVRIGASNEIRGRAITHLMRAAVTLDQASEISAVTEH